MLYRNDLGRLLSLQNTFYPPCTTFVYDERDSEDFPVDRSFLAKCYFISVHLRRKFSIVLRHG